MSEAVLDDFLFRLDALDIEGGSVEAVWDLSVDHFASNGFDRVIYMREENGSAHSESSLGAAWHDAYAARDAARFDPFLSICCLTYRPIPTGIDYLARHSSLAPVQRRLIGDAAEFGLRAGFSATTRLGGRSGAAGWNLGSSLGAREVDALRRDREDRLRLAARHACGALSRHRLHKPARLLSAREAECLAHAARGLRTKQIAHVLGVTPGAVDLYLRNARTKLGAATREQAVAVALAESHIALGFAPAQK